MLLDNENINKVIFPTEKTKTLILDGQTQDFQVWRIDINSLYYNDQNGRIASYINRYEQENGELPNHQTETVKYNDLIASFIRENSPSRLDTTKKSIKLNTQIEAGVVLNDGRVIDGNRRFTCIRELTKEFPNHFGYFNAVILDRDYTNNRKTLRTLEMALQHGVDTPLDFDLVEKLITICKEIIIEQNYTPQQYSNLLPGLKASDFNLYYNAASLIPEFLNFINAPGKYYLIKDLNLGSALLELGRNLSKLHDDDLKEDLKLNIFTIYATHSRDAREKTDKTNPFVHAIRPIYNLTPSSLRKYLDNSTEIVENFLSTVPDTLNANNIAELRSKNTDTVKSLMNEAEKYQLQDNLQSEHDKPIKLMNKIIQEVGSIEKDVVRRLNDSDYENFMEKLNQATELLNDLKNNISK